MAGILKPFSDRLSPRFQVPAGQLMVDWTHPLAQGLVLCYAPGAMRFKNITGLGTDLTLFGSPSSVAMIGDQEGLALDATSAESWAYDHAAPVVTAWNGGISMFVRARQLGNVVSNQAQFGVYADITGNNSFCVLQSIGSSTGHRYCWNNGSNADINGTTQTVGSGPFDMGFSGAVNNTSQGASGAWTYLNGIVQTKENFPATLFFTSSAVMIGAMIGNRGSGYPNSRIFVSYFWNRILTSAEHLLLHLDPYALLLSVEYELPALRVAAAAAPALSFTQRRQYLRR